MSNKEKFALYLEPQTRSDLDYWYEADNCASRTEFIEKALKFYMNYLQLSEPNTLLPTAVSSAIEGRLDSFENRLSRLMFKQTVELSMLMRIIANDTDLTDGELDRLRGLCVRDVKSSNGNLSFRDE